MIEETNNDSMLKDVLTVLIGQNPASQATFVKMLKQALVSHHATEMENAEKAFGAVRFRFEEFTKGLTEE